MTAEILGCIFIALVLIIGGDRTVKALITLCGNALIISLVIMTIYWGAQPLAVILCSCTAICALTLFYQNEVNIKTKAAFISAMLISALMIMLIVLFVYHGHIQGLAGTSLHNIRETNGYYGNIGINMMLIQVSVILIALLGAVIDTSISIASGCFEVARHHERIGRKEMFLSGMRIGGEILSSTVNTLFFIFMGEFLVMFVNFALYCPVDIAINSKEFAQGVICIMISAAGCILTIPATAFTIAIFMKNRFTGEAQKAHSD